MRPQKAINGLVHRLRNQNSIPNWPTSSKYPAKQRLHFLLERSEKEKKPEYHQKSRPITRDAMFPELTEKRAALPRLRAGEKEKTERQLFLFP